MEKIGHITSTCSTLSQHTPDKYPRFTALNWNVFLKCVTVLLLLLEDPGQEKVGRFERLCLSTYPDHNAEALSIISSGLMNDRMFIGVPDVTTIKF